MKNLESIPSKYKIFTWTFLILVIPSCVFKNPDKNTYLIFKVAETIQKYLEIIIWPSIIMATILIFRKEIEKLIARLQKADFQGGGVSISLNTGIIEAKKLAGKVSSERLDQEATEIRKEIREGRKLAGKVSVEELSQQTEDLPLTEPNLRMLKLGLQPSPSGLNIDYYRKIAVSNPNLALSGLRLEVDVLAHNLAKEFKIKNISPYESGEQLIRKLCDSGSITKQQSELVLKILELSNAGVHGSIITRDEAEQVIDIASVLVDQYISWLSWGFDDDSHPKSSNQVDL